MRTSAILMSWTNKIGVLLVIMAFGLQPAFAQERPKEVDQFLIDTAVADFGAAGVHLFGKPPGPASIYWRDGSPRRSIGGALYLDSFMTPQTCAQLVVAFLDKSGSRVSATITVYDYWKSGTTTVTTTVWYSDCLNNLDIILNKIVLQRRYGISSDDSRIHTIRIRTRYRGYPDASKWIWSKRYCSDLDGVNGYRVC